VQSIFFAKAMKESVNTGKEAGDGDGRRHAPQLPMDACQTMYIATPINHMNRREMRTGVHGVDPALTFQKTPAQQAGSLFLSSHKIILNP
jgi:hypothetical protein